MTAADIHNDLTGMVGTVLDGTYRLDELIGEGGMGAVYRGRHVLLKRDVAIKVLHPDFNRDPELVRRFDREAQSAARLNHPNCIHVSAYGTTDKGMRYLVMQLLEGVELADLLSEAVEPRQAVEWALQILRGLEHAHSQGVIHRDLKPQNVFVTRDHEGHETLKLVDFGIAKIAAGEGSTEALTRMGMVFGTPQYMSPEQALGQEIDARADLYAVGVLMFQMLTGRMPFHHEDAVAVIRMQVSTEAPPLPESVPLELAAIVNRLLAKQREQRFPDARTVRLALERYLSTLAPRKGKKPGGVDPLIDVAPGVELSGMTTINRPLPEALRPRDLGLAEVISTGRWRRDTWLKGLITLGIVLLLGGAAYAYVAFGGDDEADAPPPAAEVKSVEPSVTPTPPPPDKPKPPGPDDQELRGIDDLIAQGKLDEAKARIDALLQRFPGHAQLVWRDGRQLSRSVGRDAALPRYAEAFKTDPELARDMAFHAEVDALLRQRPVTEAALDLAIGLGPSGYGVLIHYINDPKPWATYAQRRRIRDAIAGDPGVVEEIDTPLNLRRDLEQYAKASDPCGVLLATLKAIQSEPNADYIPALKAAQPPVVPGEADKRPPLCKQADALLATVRTEYAQKFPQAFAPTPAPKKKKKAPVKKKKR